MQTINTEFHHIPLYNSGLTDWLTDRTSYSCIHNMYCLHKTHNTISLLSFLSYVVLTIHDVIGVQKNVKKTLDSPYSTLTSKYIKEVFN